MKSESSTRRTLFPIIRVLSHVSVRPGVRLNRALALTRVVSTALRRDIFIFYCLGGSFDVFTVLSNFARKHQEDVCWFVFLLTYLDLSCKKVVPIFLRKSLSETDFTYA